MSIPLINQYYNNLDRAIQFGKSRNEQAVRNHFWFLLNDYARKQNYEVVTEVTCMGTKGAKVRPDGIIKNLFGLDIGLWESKDEKDSIDDEIDSKFKKGYPFTNILFEDTQTAVLFQRGEEVFRVPVRDAEKLDIVLNEFISFKNDIIYKFEDALEKFKDDIPTIVDTLRIRIETVRIRNKKFAPVCDNFLEICRAEINPEITEADIREMMIQHILTSDIFSKVFDDAEFHRHNNIALELEKLIDVLFTYSERKNLLGNIEHYYEAIRSAASSIADHHEKQKFLKVLYENFYKVYNPKAADRLGVVYTPNEIVQFMIENTDFLLFRYFGKTFADKEVEILDPATGTGTFITSIIDSIPKQHLIYKYKNEIHANEIAILPYYVANLNIEFTFKQKMGYYEEFKNLCFVDTLDNIDGISYSGQQHNLFGLSSENSERIKRQNCKKISVIIGNPPYNANQANENDNNKNREYPEIDKRIKNTYIAYSTAQKTKVYDMYARFYRWASDRLDKNGILAFITNRSFIDSRTFDGFRKCIYDEFSFCYIIDTKSDVRANTKIAGTTHNVFGIQTGIAIMFLVKKENFKEKCKIHYISLDDELLKEEKLDWLCNNKLEEINFQIITPDKNNNWINLTDNDWNELIPINQIFNLTTNGIVTNRDNWVYDFDYLNLIEKVKYLNKVFNKSSQDYDESIKWSETLKRRFDSGSRSKFNEKYIIEVAYRAFVKKYFYSDQVFSDRLTSNHLGIYGKELNKGNPTINVYCVNSSHQLSTLASSILSDLCLIKQGNGGTFCLPLYRFNDYGEQIENITEWGLKQFQNHYFLQNKKSAEGRKRIQISNNPTKKKLNHEITKTDIFYYTYAVLHDPNYKKKYEFNLRRDYPRLPFYYNFWEWVKWGETLIHMHINYESAKPYPLKEHTFSTKSEEKRQKKLFGEVEEPDARYSLKPKNKVKLKAVKEKGIIEIDEITFLSGIPKEAWEYKLGNRSALEWILDQYKESKSSDPTIAENFNTYQFADYKKQVVDLIKKVCTVSVETMKIVTLMGKDK